MDIILESKTNDRVKVYVSQQTYLITQIVMGNFRASGIVWTDKDTQDTKDMMDYLIEIHREDPDVYPLVYDICKVNQKGLMSIRELERCIFDQDMVEWNRKIDVARAALTKLIIARDAYVRLPAGIPSHKSDEDDLENKKAAFWDNWFGIPSHKSDEDDLEKHCIGKMPFVKKS